MLDSDRKTSAHRSGRRNAKMRSSANGLSANDLSANDSSASIRDTNANNARHATRSAGTDADKRVRTGKNKASSIFLNRQKTPNW